MVTLTESFFYLRGENGKCHEVIIAPMIHLCLTNRKTEHRSLTDEYSLKDPGTKGFLPREAMLSVEIWKMMETLRII